jgi:hypothetical protein
MPATIPSRPASKKAIPAINSTIIIKFIPAGPEMHAAANATIPSYCVQRQPTIAAEVPERDQSTRPERRLSYGPIL